MPKSVQELARMLDPSRTNLLLGAGASVPSGGPAAAKLAEILCTKLGEPTNSSRSLATTAEILEMKHGRRAVFDALRDVIKPLNPTGGILALPHYDWRGIYTTNYDLLVEKAYSRAHHGLIPVRSNYDFPDLRGSTDTPLFKIHGCISQDRSLGHQASIVLTETDIQGHLDFRKMLFDRMKADLDSGMLLVIGHSLADQHLRDLVREVAKLQTDIHAVNHVVILVYQRDDDLAALYERQGLCVVFGGIDDALDALTAHLSARSHVTPQRASDDFNLPAGLLACTMEVAELRRRPPQPSLMFNGRQAGYGDIEAGLTFERNVESDIGLRLRSRVPGSVITGVAGAGKTSTARRVLVKFNAEGFHCWEHQDPYRLRKSDWLKVEEQLRSRNEFGALFIDNIHRYQQDADELVEALAAIENRALVVLGTSETSQWTYRIKSRRFFEHGAPFKMERLTDTEIVDLVSLVERSSEIAKLVSISFRTWPREKQIEHLKRRCRSDMFVCLKNIFETTSLDQIILKEHNELAPELQNLYRHVAALEAAGLQVHRQLIIRLLGIEAEHLKSIFAQMDGLIQERDLIAKEGIYLWETRHRTIAELLTQYKYAEPAEYLNLLQRVCDGLNPAFPVELDSVSELCSAEYGIKRIANREDRLRLYESLIRVAPTEHVPRHRLIREFIDDGLIPEAEAALEIAIREAGPDATFQRYRITCLIKRSQAEGLQRSDKVALLTRAHDEAQKAIARYQTNKYVFFVADDIAHAYHHVTGEPAWLESSIASMREAFERTLDPDFTPRINESRRVLRSSTQSSLPPDGIAVPAASSQPGNEPPPKGRRRRHH